MPLNEGEQQALLTQVTVQMEALQKKLRMLGLSTVKVGLFDEITRLPLNHPVMIVQMVDGWCLKCFAGPRQNGETPHTDECAFRPQGQP